MGFTKNYNLYVEDDENVSFKGWRTQINSSTNSNMTKIEDALTELNSGSEGLANHTNSKNNPHGVTAAQVGAATPTEVTDAIQQAIRGVFNIGDIKTTLGTPGEDWLLCDGRGINRGDYPELTELLSKKRAIKLDVKSKNSVLNTNGGIPDLRNGYYHDGLWVIVGNPKKIRDGYGGGVISSLDIPLIYVTKDLYGEWEEIKLSEEKFQLIGVWYDPLWNGTGRWIIYGNKIVSETQCYPYYFYSSTGDNLWTPCQISSIACGLTCGSYSEDNLVLYGEDCSDIKKKYIFTLDESRENFTESNMVLPPIYTRPGQAVYPSITRAAFGGGYWAFIDGFDTVYGSTNPAGPYTFFFKVRDEMKLVDICYGGGTWCILTWDGHRFEMFYTRDNLSNFFPSKYFIPLRENRFFSAALGYSDGAFVVVTEKGPDSDTRGCCFVSTDNCVTWKFITKNLIQRNISSIVSDNHHMIILDMNTATLICHPGIDADAVLPNPLYELENVYGNTYIKCK